MIRRIAFNLALDEAIESCREMERIANAKQPPVEGETSFDYYRRVVGYCMERWPGDGVGRMKVFRFLTTKGATMTTLRQEAEEAARRLQDEWAGVPVDEGRGDAYALANLFRRLAGALPEWRPISELHEDDEGKMIMTIGGRRLEPVIEPAEPIYWVESLKRGSTIPPTHFMPLPTLPVPEEKG